MDKKDLDEIKKDFGVTVQTYNLQSRIQVFHPLGNTNFFQHFKTNDGIDFGVCHLYWDKSR